MQIFGLAIVIGGAGWLVNYIIQDMAKEAFLEDPSSITTYLFAETGISIVLAILGAIISGVVYHDLRAIKDGVNIDELAAVFD